MAGFPTNALCYSLPRLATAIFSIAFTTFLRDLYINTFKWDPGIFSTINSVYTLSLIVFYIAVGTAVYFSLKYDNKQLDTAKYIEIAGVALHVLTFLFIVLLPYIWSRSNPTHLNEIPGTSLAIPKFGPDKPVSKDLPAIDYLEPHLEYEAIYGVTLCKRVIIYLLTVAHAAGLAAFELSNRAIPSYICGNNKDRELKEMSGVNVFFYGLGAFIINLVVAIAKYYYYYRVNFGKLFISLTVILILFVGPILYIFYQYSGNENSSSNGSTSASDWCKLATALIFHLSISFWMCTSNKTIIFISNFVLEENANFKFFGPVVLLTGFVIGTIGYGGYIIFTGNSTNDTAEKIAIGASIVGQTFIYLLFKPFNFFWNTNNWFNFLLLFICGMAYGVLLTNIYIILDGVLKKNDRKADKWIIIGVFLAFTKIFTSFALHIFYKFYDEEKLITYNCSCIVCNFVCRFPTAYLLMALFFQGSNVVAGLIHCFASEIGVWDI